VTTEITHVTQPPIPYDVLPIGLSAGPFGGRRKRVIFLADQGCSGVRVIMVARHGPVLPTSADQGIPILDATLSLRPGVPEEFAVAVPGSVRKPFWVRCFAVAGQARLIDPPVKRLKET